MEVTSNIWGTKFKMHGLVKNVPANLGQVTYKTSLLHLQPRQMTLTIAELRDDQPPAPDPGFNPNIFSEDEEDVFPARRAQDQANCNLPPAAEPAPRNNNPAALARAESYDEFPRVDAGEPPPPARRVATPPVPSRHAISPLRCEGSVPTLQSPKNAVAPTDIIFERPSPQTVSCGGRGDFCGGRADYGVRENGVSLKSNLSNVEQQTFSLNLEPSRQVTIKKCDSHVTDNCLSKLRKNICSRGGEGAAFEVNTRILKSLCNKNYEHEVHPDAPGRREAPRGLQRADDLRFIDEEPAGEPAPRSRQVGPPGAPGAPVSPACAPVHAAMPRSCSVGYLDVADPAALHARVSLAALRGEPPRRLVLVGDSGRRRRRRAARADRAADGRPSLRKCGKSRSLDSSELSLEKGKRQSRLDTLEPARAAAYPVCTLCRLVAPNDRRAAAAPYVCAACAPPPPPPAPPSPRPPVTDSDSDYSKYYS